MYHVIKFAPFPGGASPTQYPCHDLPDKKQTQIKQHKKKDHYIQHEQLPNGSPYRFQPQMSAAMFNHVIGPKDDGIAGAWGLL